LCAASPTGDRSPAIEPRRRRNCKRLDPEPPPSMFAFLATRLLRAAITILLVVTFGFVVLRLSGDPALLIMSVDAPPEAIEAFRRAWGLDGPIGEQSLSYASHALTGNLGRSMRDGRPAIELVLERVPATLAITLPALALKLLIGIPAGIYAALN